MPSACGDTAMLQCRLLGHLINAKLRYVKGLFNTMIGETNLHFSDDHGDTSAALPIPFLRINSVTAIHVTCIEYIYNDTGAGKCFHYTDIIKHAAYFIVTGSRN